MRSILNHNYFYYSIILFFLIINMGHTIGYGFIYDDRFLFTTFIEAAPGQKVKAMKDYANFHFYPIYFFTHIIDDFLTKFIFKIETILDPVRMIIPRISNLIFHFLNTCLIFKILGLVFKNLDKRLILLSIFFFLLHPLASQPVFNITARNELLYLMFASLAFISSFKFIQTEKGIHLFNTCLFLFCALCSKLFAIFFVTLIPLYFFLENYFIKYDKINLKRTITLITALFFTLIVYLIIRNYNTNSYILEFDNQILKNFFGSFYFYLKSLFFPLDHFYVIANPENYLFGLIFFLLLLKTFFYSVYLLIKKKNLYLLFFFLWLGSSLAIPIYFGTLTPNSFPLLSELAERYSYGSLASLPILICFILDNFQKDRILLPSITIISFFFVLVFSFLLFERSKVYKNDYIFWSSAERYHRLNHLYFTIVPSVILSNAAFINNDKALYSKAVFFYNQTYQIYPNSITNLQMMAHHYLNWDKVDEYKKFINYFNDKFGESPQVIMQKVERDIKLKNFKEALSKLEKIQNSNIWKESKSLHRYDLTYLNFSPDDTYFNFGICYANLNDYKNAKKYFEKAYQYNPLHSSALYNHAVLEQKSGNKDLAIKLLFNAVNLNPNIKKLIENNKTFK